jgi:hypothetical protein
VAHDVFISYSSKDKPVADAACAKLESNGIRCWIAPRDIRPGADWGTSIVRAISEARLFVLIFSSSANISPQIKREVERSVNRGIPIIPVRVEDVAPSDSLEYFISTSHWLDAFPPPLDRHLVYLSEVARGILMGDVPAEAVAGQTTLPQKRRSPSRGLLYGGVAAGVLALLLAAGAWYFLGRPPDDVQFGPECLQVVDEPSAQVCSTLRQHIGQWQSCSSAFATQDMGVALSRAQALIDKGMPASAIYFGPQYYHRAYGTTSHYWEKLGQCVEQKYIGFDQLSGTAFPLFYWEHTRQLRHLFRDNWSGAGVPLPSYMSNFRALCELYKADREKQQPGGGKVFDCSQ